jgi:DNA-binding GntR family transcriptional regulator
LLQAFRNLSHNMVWHMLWRSEEPFDFLSVGRRQAGLADYEQVLDAIAASDADRAERFMRKIMRDSAGEVIARMRPGNGDKVQPYRLAVL